MAGIGLALYALGVWPANIHHFALDMARESAGEPGSLGLGYGVPRMIAQPIVIWLALWVGSVGGPCGLALWVGPVGWPCGLALWAGEVTNWPLARRNQVLS